MAAKKKRRTHPEEFKLAAIKRVHNGEGIPQVAADVGIHANLLYGWVNKALKVVPVVRRKHNGTLELANGEFDRLRAELVELRKERDFFKRAAILFAQQAGVDD